MTDPDRISVPIISAAARGGASGELAKQRRFTEGLATLPQRKAAALRTHTYVRPHLTFGTTQPKLVMLFLLPRCALQKSKRQLTYRFSSLTALVKYEVRRPTCICSYSKLYATHQLKDKRVCQNKSLLLQNYMDCAVILSAAYSEDREHSTLMSMHAEKRK